MTISRFLKIAEDVSGVVELVPSPDTCEIVPSAAAGSGPAAVCSVGGPQAITLVDNSNRQRSRSLFTIEVLP